MERAPETMFWMGLDDLARKEHRTGKVYTEIQQVHIAF